MGPLQGLNVLEIASIGPGPFAAMMLADMGAKVLRVDRADGVGAADEPDPRFQVLNRGRSSIALDLKHPAAIAAVLKLVAQADVLIEGFRPGVMERLGLGPADCEGVNPRLIYGRMTGWGQSGPLSPAAGHDINYIALTGALHAIGREGEAPVPPLNLVGDYGGGSLYLIAGILAALFERERSGKGQVVDAAIVDGAASLASFMFGGLKRGSWSVERGHNYLDGGRHYYDVYETKDGRYISVGSIEPKFYALLLDLIGLNADDLPAQNDTAGRMTLRERFAAVFRQRTRDEWCSLLEGTDACFAPVLTALEAPLHPHNIARNTFIEVAEVPQPAPAPRFSRTPQAPPALATRRGAHTRSALAEWGFDAGEIDGLLRAGAAVQAGDGAETSQRPQDSAAARSTNDMRRAVS